MSAYGPERYNCPSLARAEQCLRIARKALADAAEWEAQHEHAHADVLGDVSARALEAAIYIDTGAL